MNDKVKVASLSIASNTMLTLGKLIVGLSMNSVSVISEAIHSGLDLIAALIAFFAVRLSAKPADEDHNYGHGKYENVASIIEALLIIVAAVMIILNAIPKLKGGGEIHSLGLGAFVMAVSAVVNIIVSRKLMKVAKITESPALAADGWHLLTDVYTSLGVLAGLLAIYATGLTIIDPLIGIGVAILIFKAACDLIRDSMRSILDSCLPKSEEQIIHDVLDQYSNIFVEYHNLRTRRAGSDRYIDLHLIISKDKNINEIHELCYSIEQDILRQLPNVQILIYTEPERENSTDKCKIEG